MQDNAPAAVDYEALLGRMIVCAEVLTMRYGEAATAEPDLKKGAPLAEIFLKGFQAVRLGVRLIAGLHAAPKPAVAGTTGLRTERLDTERPETVQSERLETEGEAVEAERDREGDYEPVSLPKFLATLRGVAVDAARVNLPEAKADVARLDALLGGAKADAPASPPAARPSAAVALLTRPPPAAGRAALLGSAAPAVRGPILPRPPPRRSG